VNYVALNAQYSVASQRDPLSYYFPSWDLVLTAHSVISPMGTWDLLTPSFHPCSSHDFLEFDFPLKEELVEAMIFNYQRSPSPEPLKGLVPKNCYV